MPNTYSYTNTYTFTQTEAVVNQYAIALDYANVLDDKETELLLKAIGDRYISSVGIYAYNTEKKRVSEVKIKVDWKKHQQIISAFGDIFDEGQAGFNYKKGEAAETKVFVNKLVKNAKQDGLKLSVWIKTSESITGEERVKLLKKIGFDGGRPEPWSGDIIDEVSTQYQTLPQMEIEYKASK